MQKIYLLAILLLVTLSGFSQDKKPVQSPRAYVNTPFVSVSYGQPSMRGREIFGKLVPYGEVWRTGANEATEITFKKDVVFAGHDVKAGTYTLFTIPNADEWQVILNKKLKQWGSFDYDKIKDQDVLKASVKTMAAGPVEKFTIEYAGNELILKWEKTKVAIPLVVKK